MNAAVESKGASMLTIAVGMVLFPAGTATAEFPNVPSLRDTMH